MSPYRCKLIRLAAAQIHMLTMGVVQFRYPAVQRCLHDITGEMCKTLSSTLSMFMEIGRYSVLIVQPICRASTVATFFSVVSAMTLQISFDRRNDPLSGALFLMTLGFNHDICSEFILVCFPGL